MSSYYEESFEEPITPAVLNKINILESNLGRVFHQHQSLKTLQKQRHHFEKI